MFALKPRKELEIAIRILLIAVILFNAFVSNAIPVQARQETVAAKNSRLQRTEQEDGSFPTFERPEPRMGERNSDNPSSFLTNDITKNINQFDPQSDSPIRLSEIEKRLKDLQEEFEYRELVPNPVREIKLNQQPFASGQKNNNVFTQRAGSEEKIYTITALADTDDGVCDSECSYREAIYAANDEPGVNTITFNVSGRLQIDSPLPYSTDPAGLTIDGSGQDVTFGNISSSSSSLATTTDACPPVASSLTLSGVTLSGCRIYVWNRLTVTNSTFLSSSWIDMLNADAEASLTNVTFMDSGIFCNRPGCITRFYGSNTFTRSHGSLLETSISGTVTWDHGNFTAGPMTISDGMLDIRNISAGLSHIDNLDTGTLNALNINFYGGGDITNAGTLNIGNSIHIRTSINNNNNGSVQIKNSTLLGSNVSNSNTANLQLYNTILAQGSDCLGTATTGQYNLIESSSHACGLSNELDGNIIGSAAQLDEGQILTGDGFTHYYIPNGNSPVIDTGNDAVCANAPISNTSFSVYHPEVHRPQGGHCDIGAVEVTVIPELSIVGGGIGDRCLVSAYSSATGFFAGPINTYTGAYDYSISDISIPTSAGNLTFQREYTSLSIDNPTTFSPGWTHNHDSRLIFPDDPGGLEDRILFKAHTANQYIFAINSDGTYSAYPGLCSTLVNEQGTYIIKDSGQNTYTFDSTGKLRTYANTQGHSWTYTYPNGQLDQIISDDGKSLDLRICKSISPQNDNLRMVSE